MAKWKGPRPVARKLFEAIAFDVYPDSPAVLADFFITDQQHYEALYYPIREGEITLEDLDRVLGDPKAITELVNKSPSNPHQGIVFGFGGSEGLGARKAKTETRTELWERLWGSYVEKLARIDELKSKGRYGYQLRMPYRSLKIAQETLLKEFPEADIYTDPALFEERKRMKPNMGLHTEDEQVQAVDLAADSLSRGLEAASSNNLFGLSKEIGYLESIADLAKSEGVESVASIALANQIKLLQEFEKIVGQLEGSRPTMGVRSHKERQEAYEMAVEAYHRGVQAAQERNALGLASEIGYLTAIRELAQKARAKDLISVLEEQIHDLMSRMERNFPGWGRGLIRE